MKMIEPKDLRHLPSNDDIRFPKITQSIVQPLNRQLLTVYSAFQRISQLTVLIERLSLGQVGSLQQLLSLQGCAQSGDRANQDERQITAGWKPIWNRFGTDSVNQPHRDAFRNGIYHCGHRVDRGSSTTKPTESATLNEPVESLKEPPPPI